MLSEGSDVYSFGVLLMEIITGRSPVDYSRPVGEVKTCSFLHSCVSVLYTAPLVINSIIVGCISDELGRLV